MYQKKCLILKFGGASLSTPNHIEKVAEIIAKKKGECEDLLVVVSAMGLMTDFLIRFAKQIHPDPPKREHDMLLSIGERISMSLLAMALHKSKIDAVSFTGSQAGVITDTCHGKAKIVDIRPQRILQAFSQNKVVIVAGFQGMSLEKEITTLGRGGSDTSAVALGIALGCEKVEFYKDVLGIYQQDPGKQPLSKLYRTLSYEEAYKIAKEGSGILHPRSILLASKNQIPLHVIAFDKELQDHFLGTKIGSQKRKKPLTPIFEEVEEEAFHLSR